MTLLDKSPGRLLPVFIILISKQDLTVFTHFILRGGKNIPSIYTCIAYDIFDNKLKYVTPNITKLLTYVPLNSEAIELSAICLHISL